ncbi:hypothetical protein FQN54_003814 [Arachnomyces sp. PD_36]|nr:hypothetical protein FQN54_003814 [Arachnomyces sp. PD_36]
MTSSNSCEEERVEINAIESSNYQSRRQNRKHNVNNRQSQNTGNGQITGEKVPVANDKHDDGSKAENNLDNGLQAIRNARLATLDRLIVIISLDSTLENGSQPVKQEQQENTFVTALVTAPVVPTTALVTARQTAPVLSNSDVTVIIEGSTPGNMKDSYMIHKLRAYPRLRPAILRERKIFKEKRMSNLEAGLAHTRGEFTTEMCDNCENENDSFSKCIVISDEMKGFCTNCHYGFEGVRCTLHLDNEGRKKSTSVKKVKKGLSAASAGNGPIGSKKELTFRLE